jgi:hypothetical protein
MSAQEKADFVIEVDRSDKKTPPGAYPTGSILVTTTPFPSTFSSNMGDVITAEDSDVVEALELSEDEFMGLGEDMEIPVGEFPVTIRPVSPLTPLTVSPVSTIKDGDGHQPSDDEDVRVVEFKDPKAATVKKPLNPKSATVKPRGVNVKKSDLDEMKYTELRSLCKVLGVSAKGKKVVLLERLRSKL